MLNIVLNNAIACAAINVADAKHSLSAILRNELESMSPRLIAKLESGEGVSHTIAAGWRELERAHRTAEKEGHQDQPLFLEMGPERYRAAINSLRAQLNRAGHTVFKYGITVEGGKLVRVKGRDRKTNACEAKRREIAALLRDVKDPALLEQIAEYITEATAKPARKSARKGK